MDETSSHGPSHIERPPLAPTATSRRRPSGEPPPLPHQLGRTGKFWLIMMLYFIATVLGVLLFPSFGRFWERWDAEHQRRIVSLRTDSLTEAMLVVNWLTFNWTLRILRWATLSC